MKKGLNKSYFYFTTLILLLSCILVLQSDKNKIKIIRNAPSGPHLAYHRDFITTVDPNEEYIPVNRLIETRKDLRLKSSATLNGILWREIPAHTGGRTRNIIFDPNDPDKKKAWACSSTGGLWKNSNIHNPESPWIPVSNRWESLATNCIAFDPQNPSIIFVGTGEGQTASYRYRESSGKGAGIYISTDAGESWELLRSTNNYSYINDIVIRIENNISVIYAAVVSGYYKGQNHYSQPSEGLFRSENNGQTWTQVLPSIPGHFLPYAPSDIEIAANGRIFVGTMRSVTGDGASVILYSDDGFTWQVFKDYQTIIKNETIHKNNDKYYNIPGRVILAAAPSDSNRVYALFESALEEHIYLLGHCYYIIRSDDNGENWTQISTPSDKLTNFAYIAWHALMAEVDPENPNKIYIGGYNIWKSENSGNTWNEISSTEGFLINPDIDMDKYVHADIHSIEFMPGSTDTAIICTDGGMHYTSNLSNKSPKFREANYFYNTTQYYTCAIHPEDHNTYLLGGTQDNSTYFLDGTTITPNNRIMSGDGAYCFIDQDQPNIQIATMQWNYFGFSTDGMKNYDYVPNYYSSGLFINPMDYDHTSNILYCNAGMQYGYYLDHILIVENIGTNPFGSFVKLKTNGNSPFSAVRLNQNSPLSNRILYLGNEKGQIFKVQDIHTNPTSTEIGKNLPAAYVSCIETGYSEKELLVTYSNYGVKSVWYSPDEGNNWFDKEGNLPDIPVRWIISHPHDPDNVILATESGIWVTNNFLEEDVNWSPANNGMPNIRVDMLRMRKSDNFVLAATHGRGMYSTNWNLYTSSDNPESITTIKYYPNPVRDKLFIISEKEIQKVNMYNSTGQLLKHEPVNTGNRISLDMRNITPGNYIIQVIFNDQSQYSEKVIKH